MKYEVKVTFEFPDDVMQRVANAMTAVFEEVPEPEERDAVVLNALLTTLLSRMAEAYGTDPSMENFHDGFDRLDNFNFNRGENANFTGAARIQVNKVD